VREIGFAEYEKIIKYENVTGKLLANVTKKILTDRLGMIADDI
jgi:SAM domain (Sterile alpha motif)